MNKFEINIVPDKWMIPIAVSAAQEYARYYFKNEKDIKAIGPDFAAELRRNDRFVRKNGGLTNEIFINADDPGAVFACEEAVRQGYFCVRYMPCPEGRDYLVFAKMYSDPLDYSTIKTTSPYTEMLERVRSFDPEQQI